MALRVGADQRQRLKALIDERTRSRVASENVSTSRKHCRECGAEFDSVTAGCGRCRERARSRRRQSLRVQMR
jgi:hypothetical protein